MEIRKNWDCNILKKIMFLEIGIDPKYVDTKYFIQKIEKGIHEENNLSNKTHVKGKMTDFKYFNADEKFVKLLSIVFSNFPNNFPKLNLRNTESWGIKMCQGDYTTKHNHDNSGYSSVLYLTDSNDEIIFEQLNLKIKPKKNTFLFFDAALYHEVERLKDKLKYAIACNYVIEQEWVN
jgi:hypothetical protein